MKRLRILTIVSVLMAVIVFVIKNRVSSTIPAGQGLVVNKAWLITNPRPLTPKQDTRPPDQTFLTYPEWFLVFSPVEQAYYFQSHTSTTFPYLKHVDQMWKSYDIMYHQVKGNFPFNSGYHVMIMVIAGSTTVEYSIKSFYETIIGRVTDTPPGQPMTDEDKFNAAYEQSYVDFIKDLPWYEYDFNHQLKTLWTGIPLWGVHPLRKLERRYYLTTELMVKSGYGWLIGLGTKSAYGTAALTTATVFYAPPAPADNDIEGISHLPNGMAIAALPRYANFTPAVEKLALKNIDIREIAGNTGAIMLTVLTKDPLHTDDDTKILFTQPIITQPGLKRIALVTTVGHLTRTVKLLMADKVTIEHIYDY